MRSARVFALVVMAMAGGSALMAQTASDASLSTVEQLMAKVQRADYQGDRPALRQLYADLAPYKDRQDIGSRVLYWRGFALWRRAINGFNDTPTPDDLEQDLKDAVAEFHESGARDPKFFDAKIAEASSLGYLLYLHRKEPDQVQGYALKARPLLQEVQAAAPDNPRLCWVLGPIYWTRPAESGGGQAKAFEVYAKGLEAVRKQKGIASGPLDPTWGEPELLMNLAWSYLNRSEPDLTAAEKNAHEALKLAPDWHYVRDILLPQIEAAKAKKQAS